jgi:hypothetical protein
MNTISAIDSTEDTTTKCMNKFPNAKTACINALTVPSPVTNALCLSSIMYL